MNKKPQWVYISGAYRGKHPNNQNYMFENSILARAEAIKWYRRGFYAYPPHMATLMMDGSIPNDRTFLEADFDWIETFHEAGKLYAVVVLPNWKDSKGSQEEIALAKKLGCRIIYVGVEEK